MHAYWAQWSHAEIMSMQGLEISDYRDDDEDNCQDEKEETEEHNCSACMYCLGLSW